MKNIKNYIFERTGNQKFGMEFIENIKKDGKYGYMQYDPRNAVINHFVIDSWKDLVEEFDLEEEYAKKIEKIKIGQSFEDEDGIITTRIW